MSRRRLYPEAAGTLAALSLISFTAAAAQTAPPVSQTPTEIALTDEGSKGKVLRHFPSSLRLYTSDKDAPGRSNCNLGCASRWPPVLAPADATDLNDFTVVTRDDGRRQWAYKGKPLYMRYHDAPSTPMGDGDENGSWHIIPHTPPTSVEAEVSSSTPTP